MLTQLCFTLQPSPMSKATQPNTSYHVNISNATGHVECTCLGMECVDILLKDSYNSLDEMPLWVQEKLALLMMLESKATLDSIGMKIDDYTFMIDGK